MVEYLSCGRGFGALCQAAVDFRLDTDGTLRADGNGGWLALMLVATAAVFSCCLVMRCCGVTHAKASGGNTMLHRVYMSYYACGWEGDKQFSALESVSVRN